MVQKIFIEGMSCGHCAARIEKALGGLEGVSSVKVDLKSKLAEVETTNLLPADKVKHAVDEAGYQVIAG